MVGVLLPLRRRDVTFGEAWDEYLESRKLFWSERHCHDHQQHADGGESPKRAARAFSEWGRQSRPRTAAEPRIAHNKALASAELPHVTLHGLRRSFGTLSEWVEVPVGVVAQIQRHKPSAIAEKHYRRRPLDLLRMWHDKIEFWLLEQAGVPFQADAA